MRVARKARVFMSGRSQHVTIPAEFRFSTSEVYVERNDKTGAIQLSEKPPGPTIEEIFKALDEAGATDFELDRDMSPAVERDLF